MTDRKEKSKTSLHSNDNDYSADESACKMEIKIEPFDFFGQMSEMNTIQEENGKQEKLFPIKKETVDESSDR